MKDKTKMLHIDTDIHSLEALSDETIEKMAQATENPELFKKIIKNLKEKAKSKEFSISIDTNIATILKMTDSTIKKFAQNTKNPELVYELMKEFKESAKKERKDKVSDEHIFWSWSYK
ncbi:MAG: hypothetical protein N2Z20_04945 [Elusimicrobiales bacterium]|nr:hypothetical protein [Elusimicrobiales bacterium]